MWELGELEMGGEAEGVGGFAGRGDVAVRRFLRGSGGKRRGIRCRRAGESSSGCGGGELYWRGCFWVARGVKGVMSCNLAHANALVFRFIRDAQTGRLKLLEREHARNFWKRVVESSRVGEPIVFNPTISHSCSCAISIKRDGKEGKEDKRSEAVKGGLG